MQLQIWQPSGKGDETDISEVMKITTACNLDWPEVVQLSKRCGSLGGRVLRECITSPHHILQILVVFKCLNIFKIYLNILHIINDVNLRRSSPAAWEGLGQDFQGGLDMSRPFEYLSCGSKSFLADLARSGQVFWPRSNSFKARCHAIASVSSNYKFAV